MNKAILIIIILIASISLGLLGARLFFSEPVPESTQSLDAMAFTETAMSQFLTNPGKAFFLENSSVEYSAQLSEEELSNTLSLLAGLGAFLNVSSIIPYAGNGTTVDNGSAALNIFTIYAEFELDSVVIYLELVEENGEYKINNFTPQLQSMVVNRDIKNYLSHA